MNQDDPIISKPMQQMFGWDQHWAEERGYTATLQTLHDAAEPLGEQEIFPDCGFEKPSVFWTEIQALIAFYGPECRLDSL